MNDFLDLKKILLSLCRIICLIMKMIYNCETRQPFDYSKDTFDSKNYTKAGIEITFLAVMYLNLQIICYNFLPRKVPSGKYCTFS